MAIADPIPEFSRPPARTGYALLVVLAPLPTAQLESILSKLATSFPPDDLLIATQNEIAADAYLPLRLTSAPATNAAWTLTAADFVNAYQLAHKNEARAILMLGPDSGSLSAAALHDLASAVLSASVDLALPCYDLPPNAGLVNSAILYPLTRALFATRARFPLAIDLGLSLRMAERLAAAGQRHAALNQNDALLWPIAEAVVAGFIIEQYDVGNRALPQPSDPDIRPILSLVAGSLFSDVEAKAAYWQRARRLPPPRATVPQRHATEGHSDIVPMIDAFRLAYSNLLEIWSLVLPPNTLLGLKRLSVVDVASFRMPENLWARIVFDFLIAYRLRTINRGHLLGALIPLYLAWVAGHINITASGADSERHIEAVASAFDADKPYLVSRWRWPDRFNP
jgi:glucosylglycerate synthase